MQMQISTPKRLPLKRSRAARLRASLPTLRASLPPRRRQQQPPWRLIGAAAVPIVAVGVIAYVARRRFYLGVAVLAKAVEEVADAIEDAAEDLGEAAKARADQGEKKK